MKNLRNSVTKSLDGDNVNLYPYFSYLLQDLWEFGSSPQIVIDLIKKNQVASSITSVLDLGCGKGSVLIHLAREFGYSGHGIDAYPDFIEDAKRRAEKYQVAQQCFFEVGDIRDRVSELKNYDLVILGSIGVVFGNVRQTLEKVKKYTNHGGYIILDDGYIKNDHVVEDEVHLTEFDIKKQIKDAGSEIVDEYIMDRDFIVQSNREIYEHIEKRAMELIKQYPQDKSLFKSYLQKQQEENEFLENKFCCVTFLLKNI
jgi:cyclopropane fatty-acyl-phospholipid synthase-like methyltransferase